MFLYPQTFVGPESSARMEGAGICNGYVTCGETVQMTIAAATCFHNQVRSLNLSKSRWPEQAGFSATLSSPPSPCSLINLWLGLSLLILGPLHRVSVRLCWW